MRRYLSLELTALEGVALPGLELLEAPLVDGAELLSVPFDFLAILLGFLDPDLRYLELREALDLELALRPQPPLEVLLILQEPLLDIPALVDDPGLEGALDLPEFLLKRVFAVVEVGLGAEGVGFELVLGGVGPAAGQRLQKAFLTKSLLPT